MKHKAMILLGALLIGGCQTMQSVEPKVEVKSEVVSVVKKERLRAFTTTKPVACIESNLAIASLQEQHSEFPYAMWHYPIRNNRILMMVNKKAKTTTIMEYIPTPDGPDFEGIEGIDETQYICLLTTGIGLYINNKVETIKTNYKMEN